MLIPSFIVSVFHCNSWISLSLWERDGVPKRFNWRESIEGTRLRKPTGIVKPQGPAASGSFCADYLCSKSILHCQLCDNGSEPFKYLAWASWHVVSRGRGGNTVGGRVLFPARQLLQCTQLLQCAVPAAPTTSAVSGSQQWVCSLCESPSCEQLGLVS